MHVESLHCSVWEGEAVFWGHQLKDSFSKWRTRLKPTPAPSLASEAGGESSFVNGLLTFPTAIVTTIEVSDCSVQVRLDTLAVQSKEPIGRAVMATCVANLQWSDAKEGSKTAKSVNTGYY